jgi:hypothetical protein
MQVGRLASWRRCLLLRLGSDPAASLLRNCPADVVYARSGGASVAPRLLGNQSARCGEGVAAVAEKREPSFDA